MRKTLSLLFLLATVAPSFAAERFDPEAHAKTIAPFLDSQTIAVARLDVSRLDPDRLMTALEKLIRVEGSELAGPGKALSQSRKAFLDAGVTELYVVFGLADLPQSCFVVVPLPEGKEAGPVAGLLKTMGLDTTERGKGVLVAGTKTSIERVRGLKPVARPEVAQAFAGAGDGSAQVLLVPPAGLRRALAESLPQLPKELGGGSSRVVTEGLLWAGASITTTPKVGVRWVVQAKDAESARGLRGLIDKSLRALAQEKEVQRLLPSLDKAVALLTPSVAEDRLVLTLTEDHEAVASLCLDLVRAQRQAAEGQDSVHKLKQMGLALHNYHDANATFPAVARFDKQEKPLLSWRVSILPYLGEEKLYKEFHLDEPWDSEHNRKLIERMPAVYRSSGKQDRPGRTRYLGVVGKDTMFGGGAKGIAIREVVDGTSNTIFVVEADEKHEAIWTKPEDLPFDPDKPGTGVTDRKSDRFAALFVDGSVHRLPKTIDSRTLKALLTRNGGEVVEIP